MGRIWPCDLLVHERGRELIFTVKVVKESSVCFLHRFASGLPEHVFVVGIEDHSLWFSELAHGDVLIGYGKDMIGYDPLVAYVAWKLICNV
ncbi:hypothetical protein Bca4012_036978 [Brassica carinata]